MEGVSSKTEVSDKNREQIKQDVLFVRLFLEQMSQTRVLRWREEGEKPFVSAHEVRLMNEPDAEHTGQMYALTNDVLDKAVAEGDESFHDFDIMLALRMIGMHDMEESITGDVRQKDEAHH